MGYIFVGGRTVPAMRCVFVPCGTRKRTSGLFSRQLLPAKQFSILAATFERRAYRAIDHSSRVFLVRAHQRTLHLSRGKWSDRERNDGREKIKESVTGNRVGSREKTVESKWLAMYHRFVLERYGIERE